MIKLEEIYFEWLLSCINPDGIQEEAVHICGLLHGCEFHRRVGNDINRAIDGANLRKEFFTQFEEVEFNPKEVEEILMAECSWLEMLVALCRQLDFLYEGGVDGRLYELIRNLGLNQIADHNPRRSRVAIEYDRQLVVAATSKVNQNRITRDGIGGIFPLQTSGHPDQREVEIWDQHAAYFNEQFEGVLWTSTN